MCYYVVTSFRRIDEPHATTKKTVSSPLRVRIVVHRNENSHREHFRNKILGNKIDKLPHIKSHKESTIVNVNGPSSSIIPLNMNKNREKLPALSCLIPSVNRLFEHDILTTTNSQSFLEESNDERLSPKELSRRMKAGQGISESDVLLSEQKQRHRKKSKKESRSLTPPPAANRSNPNSLLPRTKKKRRPKTGKSEETDSPDLKGTRSLSPHQHSVSSSTLLDARIRRRMVSEVDMKRVGHRESGLLEQHFRRPRRAQHAVTILKKIPDLSLRFRRDSMQMRLKNVMHEQTQRSMPNIFIEAASQDIEYRTIAETTDANSEAFPFLFDDDLFPSPPYSFPDNKGSCASSHVDFQASMPNLEYRGGIMTLEGKEVDIKKNHDRSQMAMSDLVCILEKCNDSVDEIRRGNTADKMRVNREIRMEEMADILYYVNVLDDIKVEITWEAISAMVFRHERKGCIAELLRPFDTIEFIEDDMTVSTFWSLDDLV